MFFEIKRHFRNAYLPISIGVIGLFFLMGYGWLIPSHPDGIDLPDFLAAVYLVYTQFGALILAALVLSLFYADYKEKNVIFYKTKGTSAMTYYLSKVFALIVMLSLGTVGFTTLSCAIYGDFSIWGVMLLHYESVLVAYIFIMSLWGFLFSSFVVSFFVSLATWLASILIAVITPEMSFIAFYDESSPLYERLMENLGDMTTFVGAELSQFGACLIYDACLIAICLIVVFLFRKRWVKNGV